MCLCIKSFNINRARLGGEGKEHHPFALVEVSLMMALFAMLLVHHDGGDPLLVLH